MMSTISWTKRISSSMSYAFTPVLQALIPYSSGSPITSAGSAQEIPNLVRYDSQTGEGIVYLVSASVIDRSGTFGAYDLWFFNQAPDYTGDNANPFNISNSATMFGAGIGACVGVTTIGQVYSQSNAGVNGISLDGGGIWKQMAVKTKSSSLFVVIVLRNNINNYLTQSDLTFRFDFLVE